jgi:hypothetical protein
LLTASRIAATCANAASTYAASAFPNISARFSSISSPATVTSPCAASSPIVILGFAVTYFALGASHGQPLVWNEAIVISMTAFHGRGFFQTAFQPGDLQAAVAAVEAFIGLLIGLLIEIVLIATFTQRFFAR